MSNIPQELRYTRSHEWIRREEDGTLTVGITDHAQQLLGDLVFVDTPEVGEECAVGDDCAVVESVKAASDVYAPITGEIVAVNEKLADTPELLSQDPYGEGWIFRIRPVDEKEYDGLMDADAYQEIIAEEG
ncbi:MAG TPA: glycine cleavage system protein GcvH [Chromatiales bacterium]|nr:glycine cleavage system protein GcvH [Chromatiales bacterium]